MQAELLAEIYARLVERDAHEKSLAGIIEQRAFMPRYRPSEPPDRRLSQQTVILRDRNRALLKASLDNRSAPNGTAGGNDGSVSRADNRADDAASAQPTSARSRRKSRRCATSWPPSTRRSRRMRSACSS